MSPTTAMKAGRTFGYFGGSSAAREVPIGSYAVPMAQPQKRLAKARGRSSAIEWREGDLAAWQPDVPCDVVYSNAALHWVDGHERVFPSLMRAVNRRINAVLSSFSGRYPCCTASS